MANYDSTHTGATIDSAVSQVTDSTTDFNVDSNTLVVDKSANSVGIGTAAPDHLLDIETTASQPTLRIFSTITPDGSKSGGMLRLGLHQHNDSGSGANDTQDGDVLGKILFEGQGTDYTYQGGAIQVEVETGDGTATRTEQGTQMSFWTMDTSGASAERRMTIDEDGNVGIGESAPQGRVHIKNTDASTTANASADDLVIEHNSSVGISLMTDDSSTSRIYFGNNTSSTAGQIIYNHGTDNSGGYLQFVALGNTAMKLDTNSRISLSNNDGNTSNTVFGKNAFVDDSQAVLGNVGADYNVAVGELAMGTGDTTDASDNTAIGYKALEDITTGDYNTSVGSNSMAQLTDGVRNAALGWSSLKSNVSGDYNTGLGMYSLYSNTTDSNTGVGYAAGMYTTGADNTYVGYQAGHGAAGAEGYNVGVGSNALLAVTTGSVNTVVGSDAGLSLTSGHDNVMIGGSAAHITEEVGYGVFIGRSVASGLMDAGADGTIAIGYDALNVLTSGANNLAVGYLAGKTLTTGAQNLAIGREALENHVLGESNIAIGYLAMADTGAGSSSHDSDHNTFIGLLSGGGAWVDTKSEYNVGIGNYTLDGALDGAVANTALGFGALTDLTTGDYNTSIGMETLYENVDGSNNVAVGYRAGEHDDAGADATSPDQCIIIGAEADFDTTTPTNEIVIGYNANGKGDNTATIGNASCTAVYMADDSGATVHCAGIKFDASGEVLGDYEEGTWTGVVTDGTNPMSMSNDGGFYTKVGNLVTVSGYFTTNSLGSASGNIRITGLPFTVANNNAAYSGGGVGYGAGLLITAGHSVSYMVNPNTAYMEMLVWDATGGTSAMQASEWTLDGGIIIGFSYRAA